MFDFANSGFEELRLMDGITSDVMYNSLDPDANVDNAKKAGESTGKSGSFFFFSKDRKFIIKTMFDEELEIFMLSIEKYFSHIKNNPNSLIARIYGLYQVKMKGIVPVNFILMANTIKCQNKKGLLTYDLKGSIINRITFKG